jgi:methylthioxylose transferase
MVLFFVGLVRIGLGGDLAAGLVVTVLAATLPLAVLTTLRSLGRESAGRRAAPYLVLTPAAVFLAVSADAVMAVTVAWTMAALAAAARRPPATGWPYAAVAGIGFGAAVMMSYGLPLAALLALALLLAARRWWPIPFVAAAAFTVVLVFAIGGFAWWQAYPVLSDRYWAGVAAVRPASYWLWGDLAALAVSAGPIIGAGLAAAWARRRDDRVIALLVGAAALIIIAADLSRMSNAEVERIWLPFIPWLTLSVVFLPKSWHRPALAAQLLTALLVQHLLFTSW